MRYGDATEIKIGDVADGQSLVVFEGPEGLISPGKKSKTRLFQRLEESCTRKT